MTIYSFKNQNLITEFHQLFNNEDLLEANHAFDNQSTKDVLNYSLYVKQGEFGIVNLCSKVQYIGSGEATTCHIVVATDEQCVGVLHLDAPDYVDSEMTRFLQTFDDDVKCYVLGGFVDDAGLSNAISEELFNFFAVSHRKYNICMWKTLELNTKLGIQDQKFPICTDITFDMHDKVLYQAQHLVKGPNLSLRSHIIPILKQYSKIYDTVNDSLTIPYAKFTKDPKWLRCTGLPDSQILQFCSTSPHCEPANFCDDIRAGFAFRAMNSSEDVYPADGVALKYVLSCDGTWIRE